VSTDENGRGIAKSKNSKKETWRQQRTIGNKHLDNAAHRLRCVYLVLSLSREGHGIWRENGKKYTFGERRGRLLLLGEITGTAAEGVKSF